MAKTLQSTLARKLNLMNPKDLEDLRKELDELAWQTAEGWKLTSQKLGNKSIEFLKEKFDENNMSKHKDNLVLRSYGDRYKSGFMIYTNADDVIMFNEFGTGVVGKGTGILADKYGYKYNVGPKIGVVPDAAVSWYSKVYGIDEESARQILEAETTPNTWWYFKNKKWHRTEGMRGKNMFADLELELIKNGYKDYAMSLGKNFKAKPSISLEDYFSE